MRSLQFGAKEADEIEISQTMSLGYEVIYGKQEKGHWGVRETLSHIKNEIQKIDHFFCV